MVNGNYVLYGDRPTSESEIVDDHVHSNHERKVKRKNNRSANELQHSLNQAQLDNDTDSVKYQKTIKEPRLLRYVPTTDVEENFVSEKFETYDLKPTEERPRRYAFTKKPKNPTDGSVNYAYSVYSRSSSNCSSPNANLPTISEHGEQYGTYRVQTMPGPAINDLGYDTKLDKYFTKPREIKPFAAKVGYIGSHPDSLYRVSGDGGSGANKLIQVIRALRWPMALIAICIALAVFVYFLMPDNTDSGSAGNSTYWEPVSAGIGLRKEYGSDTQNPESNDGTNNLGTKTSEIDFYNPENNINADLPVRTDFISETNLKRHLPISPVFPTHLTPEVQYGNEKADSEKRTAKALDDLTLDDSTLKPHITQKPEKPLAIYFKENDDVTSATTETISRKETTIKYFNYDQNQANKNVEEYSENTDPSIYQGYIASEPKDLIPVTEQDIYRNDETNPESEYSAKERNILNRPLPGIDVSFTSGHSKLFGISIEDAEKMQSTTQSALYNTRVSPTLPTWREKDDATTKYYPTNIYSDVQCRSTRMALCRGVLPYDLAGAAAKVGDVDITSLIPQIDYLIATNCSDRVTHFVCALLEPECNPPPYTPKKPCYNLCKAIVDNCDGHIPRELTAAFQCKQYSHENCVAARNPCYTREFMCGDGSCIPRDWICDGRNDCSVGEDEAKCAQCDPTDFKCPSGGCIMHRWLCDGYADCPEGEDESDSICGASHVRVPSDRQGEPGEESAGSAPAPAVKRPNRLPNGHRRRIDRLRGEMDSSKELLVTSDSNNVAASTRSVTPSPSRLTPYNHSYIPVETTPKERKQKQMESLTLEARNSPKSPPKNIIDHESVEDVNMGDLGFFEEFEKEGKSGKDNQNMPTHAKPLHVVPPPNPRMIKQRPPVEPATEAPDVPVNRLTEETSNFQKVIDGAALLRKASAAEAAEAAAADREEALESNNTNIDNEDFSGGDYASGKQGWGRAHTSPCPSGELRCVDGLCITLAQLCDGTIDCSDHADEDNCYT
ncbi:unnamed protein product [Arctia plantaginis]|uniref:FZ domain-containing protein n=1 Tax=Arctia plantaginis TaxID=874455 RepID=A0A8S1A8J0_ARCPL|nr:unnamed protein product [Arctia plantaginis]